MCSKPSPRIPAGNFSVISGVSENFSFHASPEAFLVARITEHHRDHPLGDHGRAGTRKGTSASQNSESKRDCSILLSSSKGGSGQ